MGGDPYQPHPGAQVHCCGCSLPGLTGFTVYCREGTGTDHHNALSENAGTWPEDAALYQLRGILHLSSRCRGAAGKHLYDISIS